MINSSTTPLVSVLMTAYNREKYIAEAIESVLASTYTFFELIIVDDCSTDNTVLIAKSYQERDPRIKLFVNKQNLGDYPNRNVAASFASGETFFPNLEELRIKESDRLLAMENNLKKIKLIALPSYKTNKPSYHLFLISINFKKITIYLFSRCLKMYQ